MSQSSGRKVPRAIVHKQILDWADDHPDATMKEIASEVKPATTDLVERVLDEYGDPATEPDGALQEAEPDTDQHIPQGTVNGESVDHQTITKQSTDDQQEPGLPRQDPESLTEKQRKTLRAIDDHPEATQSELAEIFSVSRAAISKRVNSIEGFEWETRGRLVEKLFEDSTSKELDNGTNDSQASMDPVLNRLTSRVEELECQINEGSRQTPEAFSDPELTHKIVHACMSSENIAEEEELEILKGLMDL